MILIVSPMGIVGHSIWNFLQLFFAYLIYHKAVWNIFCHCEIHDE